MQRLEVLRIIPKTNDVALNSIWWNYNACIQPRKIDINIMSLVSNERDEYIPRIYITTTLITYKKSKTLKTKNRLRKS